MRNSEADLRLDNLVGSSQQTPTKLSFWLMASRPRTLTISTTPVIVGTALAWAAHGRVHWLAVLAALISSMFIQIGTNIHNDAGRL
jgi:1,4-dihydroxy-2-naphthoate octaprenyltransferase